MGADEVAQDFGLTVQNVRARRLSRTELRDRILDAGSTLLTEQGVTVSLYHLNVEELIRRVGVPRSSVFAAFGGKEELITELMVQLLRPNEARPSGYSSSTADVAAEVVERHRHLLTRPDGSRDLEGEWAVLREAVRVTLRHNVDDIYHSSQWQTYLALSASAASLPEGRRERVVQALQRTDQAFSSAMNEFYGTALASLGRRPRPGLEWRHIVTAGAAIVEGVISRRRIGLPIASEILEAPGIDGEPAEWTLAGLAYFAMIEGFTEPIPLA